MRKSKNIKSLISFVLAFVMVCSIIPFSAFASDFVASTFSVVSWRNAVESDGDGTQNIWCQFDSTNGFGWSAFQPESEACIKLVKAGKIEADAVNIGIQGQNAFINEGDSYCRIRYSEYWMNLLGVGDNGLPADGDYIIVEGKFISGDNTITVPKTYIKLTASGNSLVASSTAEQPEELKKKSIEAGSLGADSSHTTLDGEFIWTISNGTAVTDTWVNYFADNDDCVQLLKAGTTTPVSIGEMDTAMTSDSILLNRGGNTYCIRHTQWFLNCAGHSEITPLEVGDTLIVGGNFTSANGTKIHIDTTYITVDKNGVFSFSTTALGPATIEVGTMKVNSEHAALNDGGFYFTMDANELPYTEDWNTRYSPVNTDVIKLVRGGETTSVGIAERTIFVKYGENAYYLDTGNGWFMNGAPLTAGDILIVEGQFTNGTVTFHVSKSVIVVAADGSLTFATEIPTEPDIIEAGTMKVNSEHAALNNGGFYFTMDANEVPYTEDWNTRYSPVNADVIKLVRGGETTSVGIAERTIFVKYGENAYYLDTGNGWFMNGAPLAAGDILIVEGQFTNGTVTFHASKSVIVVAADGSLTFATEIPTEPDIIEAGTMKVNSENAALNNGGFYFTMDANELPYTEDWNTRYSPVNADVIKLVRGGETTSVGIAERTIFVKYGENAYYLDTGNGWFMNNAPLAAGDMLIVEGQFTNGTVTFHVNKSYIKVWDDGSLSISTTEPTEKPSQDIIEVGSLVKDPDNSSRQDSENGTGIYFTLPENEIPLNDADPWSNRFMAFNADSIKLIRDGKTTSIGNTAAGTIVKYDATHYYIDLAKWAYQDAPLTDDDILLIGGKFASGGTVFNITPTYISFSYGMVIFTDEYPTGEESGITVVKTGNMSNDERGRQDNVIYFRMNVNSAPYKTDWSLRYSPVSADCVKLVRGGVTYNIGNPGHGTIIKFSATGYAIEASTWTMGNVVPIRENDVLIFEGEFVNTETGTVITIPKNYIGIYYGMPFFSTSYPSGPNLNTVNAGTFNQDARAMTKDGLYFNLAKNTASYSEDWSLRYSPLESANVKLIRNGQTMEIGIPNRGTIVKFSETEYYLETNAWSMGSEMPLQQGDILVLSGKFISSSVDTLLELDETYIFITKAKRSLKAVFAQPVETMEASKGETIQLSAKNLSGNVTWTSSNTERATVDENGNVTVLSNRGTVYIMATVDNSGYSWQINLYDDTEYGKIYLSNTEEEIVTAVWCDSFHEFDEETLTRLEEAGVNLLIGVNAKQVGKSGMKYLLDRAKKHGIAVIADLRDWNGEKLPIYCKHSNLKGFLMWDEPTADDIEALAELKEKFDNRMPDGLTFYVSMGDQAYDINTLFDQDQLSLKLNPMNGSDNIQSDFFGTLDLVANKALKKNVAINYMIPNSTSLTGEQQSWLNSIALTYGVKGLTNYTYVQTENAEEAEALYSGMKESCGKTVSWDDIYMSYGWLGISKVDAGEANPMLEKLTNDLPVDRYGVISTVTSEQDLLVGSFVNGDSQYAYMITNAGDAKAAGDDTAVLTMEDASVTIQLKSGEYICVAVIRGGEISYVAVNADNTFTVEIAANEGVFVIPMVK